MARTDTFPLIDRLIDGGLTAYLTSARAAGESHETIAYRLRSEHEITVSSETVRKWCAALPDPSPASVGAPDGASE